MNTEKLQAKVNEMMSGLDIDKNGRVNKEDVRALLTEQVAKRGLLPVATAVMVAALVIGFVAGRVSC